MKNVNLLLLLLFCMFFRFNNGGITVEEKMTEVFAWKQMIYDFDGILYVNSSDTDRDPNKIQFVQELDDAEKFFIQYNNIPGGLGVFGDRVFVTLPRRSYGIPSTINYVQLKSSKSPALRPFPNTSIKNLVSVYRPRIDMCDRLWFVDTGMLEVPGARVQIQPPTINVFDLKTNTLVLRYKLKNSDILNERTPAGLTSITVDVDPKSCDDAYAYITDLATNGLIVFSMKQKDSWRIQHETFVHSPSAMNFKVAGNLIDWTDGIFSLALSEDTKNIMGRTAFYHPLISTQEFTVNTTVLRSKAGKLPAGQFKALGSRGPLSQSGSHAYHGPTKTVLYANVAQDAIQCWNTETPLTPENVAIIVQDHRKLIYISDLIVVGNDVWVLVNQMPNFIYSTLDPSEYNFFVHRGKIEDLIRGTPCDRTSKH